MKIILSFCFVIFFQITLLAQTYSVSGIVLESNSKQALVGATVFINNTSKYSITDSNGRYTINDISDSYFQIVCSKKGYETLALNYAPKTISNSIRFEPTALSDEKPIPDSILKKQQDKWGQSFISVFLGTTSNASYCEIENPDVLRFIHNDSTKITEIYSVAPLIVLNEALGYMVNCIIDDFFITDKGEVMYKVFKWYKPLTSKKVEVLENWSRERKIVYSNSMLRFMRALYTDVLKQEGFEVKRITRINADDPSFKNLDNYMKETNTELFNKKATPSKDNNSFVDLIDKKPISSTAFRTEDSAMYLYSKNRMLQIISRGNFFVPWQPDRNIYIDKYPSYLIFNTNKKIRIEPSGAYYNEADFSVNGFWYLQRLADSLPFDY